MTNASPNSAQFSSLASGSASSGATVQAVRRLLPRSVAVNPEQPPRAQRCCRSSESQLVPGALWHW